MKTQRQRHNLKWSDEDIDRLYRFARSVMSIDPYVPHSSVPGFASSPMISSASREISATDMTAAVDIIPERSRERGMTAVINSHDAVAVGILIAGPLLAIASAG